MMFILRRCSYTLQPRVSSKFGNTFRTYKASSVQLKTVFHKEPEYGVSTSDEESTVQPEDAKFCYVDEIMRKEIWEKHKEDPKKYNVRTLSTEYEMSPTRMKAILYLMEQREKTMKDLGVYNMPPVWEEIWNKHTQETDALTVEQLAEEYKMSEGEVSAIIEKVRPHFRRMQSFTDHQDLMHEFLLDHHNQGYNTFFQENDTFEDRVELKFKNYKPKLVTDELFDDERQKLLERIAKLTKAKVPLTIKSYLHGYEKRVNNFVSKDSETSSKKKDGDITPPSSQTTTAPTTNVTKASASTPSTSAQGESSVDSENTSTSSTSDESYPAINILPGGYVPTIPMRSVKKVTAPDILSTIQEIQEKDPQTLSKEDKKRLRKEIRRIHQRRLELLEKQQVNQVEEDTPGGSKKVAYDVNKDLSNEKVNSPLDDEDEKIIEGMYRFKIAFRDISATALAENRPTMIRTRRGDWRIATPLEEYNRSWQRKPAFIDRVKELQLLDQYKDPDGDEKYVKVIKKFWKSRREKALAEVKASIAATKK